MFTPFAFKGNLTVTFSRRSNTHAQWYLINHRNHSIYKKLDIAKNMKIQLNLCVGIKLNFYISSNIYIQTKLIKIEVILTIYCIKYFESLPLRRKKYSFQIRSKNTSTLLLKILFMSIINKC